MAEKAANKIERPLSPHLQVYRWSLTMAMSILHRATGAALAAGTLMVVWLLLSAASGAEAYGTFRTFCHSPLGMFMLFGWSAALYYHALNGIRHLFWDMGFFFKIENAYRTGYAVLAGTALLTVATWYVVLSGGGY